ncbi:MAG: sigma-70 family RNA polymerase sigma factor [Proteobacteria bacterium]|nr:sigma-70 family RNA polymerase sigma factor [Pseudomonadota bacterium]
MQDIPDLENLKKQDHQAFQRLVEKYNRQIVVVARAIIGDSLAEEVTQEAWVSVYRALPSFEGRSSIKTWIFTIVSNEAKTRLRKESRLVRINEMEEVIPAYLNGERFNNDGSWSSPPPLWDIESPEKILENEQLRQCIEKTIELLPDVQKSVFLLRDIEQQSLEEICNILDISNSNVRVLLHRARVRLMQIIDQYQETGQC